MSATRRRGISEEDDLVRQLLEADNVDAVVEKMEEDHYRHLAPIIKTLHTFDPPPPPRGAAASALPRDLSYISSVHDDLGTPLNDFYVSHARGGGGAGQGPISPVPAAGGGADAESASSRRQTSQRTYSKEYSTKSFGATSSQRRGIPPPSPPRWRGDEVPGRTTPPARTYNTTHTSGLGDEGGAANIPEGLDDPNQSRIARQLQVLQNYRELAEMCSKTSDPAVNLLQNLPTERLARQQAEQIRQQHGRSPSPITVHNTYYFNPSGQTEELSIGRHGRTGSRLHPSRRGSQRFNPPPPPPPPEHRADLRGQRLALQSPASDGGSYGGGATPPSPEPLRPDAAAASSSSYHPHPHLPPPPSPPFPDDGATHGHGANTITATTEEADTSVLEEEDYEGDFLCDDDLDDVDYDDYLREPPEPPRIIEREQHRRQPANSAAAAAASTTAPAENISAKDGGDDHDEKSNPLMSRRSSVSPKSGSISVIRGHDALVAQANDAARNHRQTPERPATATSAREEDEEADSPGNPQLRTHNPAKSSRPGKSPSRSRHGRASSDGRSDDEGSADSMDATEDTNYFDPTGPAMLTTPRRQPQQSQQQQQQYQHNNNMYARGRGRGGAMIQVPGGFARGAGRGGGVVGRGASRPYGYGAATVAVRAQPPTAAAPVSTSPAPRFVSMPGSPPMLNAYTPGQLALLNRLLERMPANHGRGRGGVAGGANGPRLQAGLLYGSLLPSARPETAMVMDPHLANAGRAASVRPVAPPPMQHVSGSAEIAGPRHASDARQRSVSAARSITTRTHRAHHSQPQDLVWQSQSSGCVVGRNGRSSAKHHRYSSHSSHHHAAERHPHRSRAASSTSSDEVMESRRRRDRRVNGGSATHASSSVPRTAVEKEQAKANAKRFGVVAL